MELTVCVGTYGDSLWVERAERAIASVPDGVPTLHCHGNTLAEARNACAGRTETEWLCFLDADDALEPGYFEAMERGIADLRAPAVRYVTADSQPEAAMPRVVGHRHGCTAECLLEGNWCVIGTLIRREMFEGVGGFHEWPLFEDWDLWLRCHLAGASIEAVPDAVYRAHVRPGSRNQATDRHFRERIYREIIAANSPPVAA